MELLPSSAKEWLTSVIWALIIYALMAVVMSFDVSAKEADAQKWERINKNKQERRIKERAYESCVQQCMKGCTK